LGGDHEIINSIKIDGNPEENQDAKYDGQPSDPDAARGTKVHAFSHLIEERTAGPLVPQVVTARLAYQRFFRIDRPTLLAHGISIEPFHGRTWSQATVAHITSSL
jgi:hypothetical protein